MTSEDIYTATTYLIKYQKILSTKEMLTQEEYDFCLDWDHQETKNCVFNVSKGRYLNLLLYSEADKEEYDLKRETGY